MVQRRAIQRLEFATFLAPLAPQEFLQHYWGQRYALLHRESPECYDNLFCIEDADRYLELARRNPASYVSIVRVGQPVRRLRVSEIDIAELYQAFYVGNTLLFEDMARVWPPVLGLARMLERALSAQIEINAYMSPPNAQGAHLHPDVCDVFVMHLEGAKRWWLLDQRVYEPIENLEYRNHLTDLEHKVAYEREQVAIGDAQERTLDRGDLLYLPRGVVHKAATTENAASLHLSIVVRQIHWVEVLKLAAEVASVLHPELSCALPPDFDTREIAPLAASLQQKFREGLAFLSESGVLERTLEVLQHARMSHTGPVGDGHFAEILRLRTITVETVVEKYAGRHCTVAISSVAASIRFGGGSLKGPAHLGRAFEFVRDHSRFSVADIPGPLDAQSKIVLVARLIRAGLLRHASPGDSGVP